MPNKNYNKGVRLERKIVNAARDENKIAFRSAGSHSPIDTCVIDMENKRIIFSQCKAKKMSENEKQTLLDKYGELKGFYEVAFVLVS